MSLRREIDRTLRTEGFLDWRAATEYAKNADPLVEKLAELSRGRSPREAAALIEHAIDVLVEVLAHADDSAGSIGDLVRRLLDSHLDASRAGGHQPPELARWLVRFGLDEQDQFTVDVDIYADPLGTRGIALYRDEVERRWSAGDRSFGVRRAKERLAFLDHDVEALVALLGGDLTISRQYLHVASGMQQLGRYDDALAWALRGLDEKPDRFVGKLYDFAVAEYLRRGAHDEALALRRRQHQQQPTEESYLALRLLARAAGTWEVDGPPALALLEQAQPQ